MAVLCVSLIHVNIVNSEMWIVLVGENLIQTASVILSRGQIPVTLHLENDL